ncbi:MAG: hypothetical protein J0L75_13720 [Spirochaetes bacterium]|nr:hypothetical protein [Spirochaetota bacterium]
MKGCLLIPLFLLGILVSAESAPEGVRTRDLGITQGTPNPGERIAERLKLDAPKKSQMVKIYEQMVLDLSKLRIQMERKQLDLKELLLSGNLEMDKIRKNCDERGKIMADMQYLAFIADSDVKKILTPEQWIQYIQVKTAMMHGAPPKPEREGDRKGEGKPRK